jgi:hypothetical protein
MFLNQGGQSATKQAVMGSEADATGSDSVTPNVRIVSCVVSRVCVSRQPDESPHGSQASLKSACNIWCATRLALGLIRGREFYMSSLAFLLRRLPRLAERQIPSHRMDRIVQAHHRRLDDALENAFQRACLNDDLDVAVALLGVLELMHQRRVDRFGKNRPIDDTAIVRVRGNVAQLRLRQPVSA